MRPCSGLFAVNTDGYRDSGGSAVQDVGFALATAVTYIGALQERGLLIDDIAPRISFEFSIGNDFSWKLPNSGRHAWSGLRWLIPLAAMRPRKKCTSMPAPPPGTRPRSTPGSICCASPQKPFRYRWRGGFHACQSL